MASTIQTIGGTQIVRLGSPLILGIRLQGTIGHLNLTNPNHIKARPYLRYFADTLRHLRCDVTLLVPTNHQADTHVISQFAKHEFPLPFRLLHDHDDVNASTNRNRTVSSKNYANFFHGIAQEHGSTLDRVLFIDSEINYRFTPVQTLVLETYEPRSRRQQRQETRRRMQEEKDKRASSPLASASSTQPHVVGAGTTSAAANASNRRLGGEGDSMHPQERAKLQKDQQRRREAHQKEVRANLDELQKHTNTLKAELHFASTLAEPLSPTDNEDGLSSHADDILREAAAAGSSNWLGRHDGRKRTVTASNTASRRRDGPPTREEGTGTASQQQQPEEKEEGRADEEGKRAGGGDTFTAEDYYHAAAESASTLAINLEDFSLVALADMITQLAASDLPVRDFLTIEPLIEKLRVPFHGVTNYLPIENCDFIEVLDWERIKVEEKEARDGSVPDVEETEEHKDFFK